MEAQADYVVRTDENSLDQLLKAGRESLEEIRLADMRREKEDQANRRREWNNALAPVREKWPWIEEYIRDDMNTLPSWGRFMVFAIIPGFAPVGMLINRNHPGSPWELIEIEGYRVFSIIPGICPSWRNDSSNNYPSLSLALAVAEERGSIFDKLMKAFEESQEKVDQQQAEKLAKDDDENPEYRLLGALHEIIQNEICKTCSF
jgi:hypothetical protein